MKAFCAPVGPDPNALRGMHSNQFIQDVFIIEPSRFTKDGGGVCVCEYIKNGKMYGKIIFHLKKCKYY